MQLCEANDSGACALMLSAASDESSAPQFPGLLHVTLDDKCAQRNLAHAQSRGVILTEQANFMFQLNKG